MLNELTVVVAASFIPTHPDMRIIRRTIESLSLIEGAPYDVLLAHDFSDNPRYREYLESLVEYIDSRSNFQIRVRESHGGLSGNLRYALETVETRFVLMAQHDLPFVRGFDVQKVMDDMTRYPEMKHVRFNKRANIKTGWDARNRLFGRQLEAVHYTYTRTPCWSDNNHLATLDYYRRVVLPVCRDGQFVENFQNNAARGLSLESYVERYGTYLFGELDHPPMIEHLDGRCTK